MKDYRSEIAELLKDLKNFSKSERIKRINDSINIVVDCYNSCSTEEKTTLYNYYQWLISLKKYDSIQNEFEELCESNNDFFFIPIIYHLWKNKYHFFVLENSKKELFSFF